MPPDADSSAEEAFLLARIGAGDRAAFRDLYARFSTPLFSFTLRLVGDRATAEELLQDAFVKIWHHANDYDPHKSRAFTWAVTIVRRTCIDHLRRRRSAPSFTPLPLETEGGADFATAETARRTAEAHETSRNVDRALEHISGDRRRALELALYSELTHAEIARQLVQPIGTVKSWIRRGLLELRTTLAQAKS
ncbi:RNA polymerase sigma factor [Synoicihabitans lomoniglobus]|uniref:Sigma-70 family RNA polymerase sigma factor n=1 Tax=Synoicihabitans lomoniglobus TaxID=2909285 RepID=A0AAE9ZU76_9BACT|nr:sigma-70 family RNA polymerase sigma factor [Opitutaceae bacterium LMO-M01]WED64381.1 sigma-70 family RNA polymerase sigma factor [Opitutaceae bacterium LMO-M01]